MKFIIGMVFQWQGEHGIIEGELKEIGENILIINKTYQGYTKEMIVNKISWENKINKGIVKKIRVKDIVFIQFGEQIELKV